MRTRTARGFQTRNSRGKCIANPPGAQPPHEPVAPNPRKDANLAAPPNLPSRQPGLLMLDAPGEEAARPVVFPAFLALLRVEPPPRPVGDALSPFKKGF